MVLTHLRWNSRQGVVTIKKLDAVSLAEEGFVGRPPPLLASLQLNVLHTGRLMFQYDIRDIAVYFYKGDYSSTAHDRFRPSWGSSAVASFGYLTSMPGCPGLDRESREADVRFEPRTFRSVNSRSNHLGHLAPI
ncbi:hypothetical protein T265_06022 [Opisthorchis viverrini]|uniref:Uncharacterized protein n=1 Tax=Opisthorchis viverrini TaxID=6198 RepID=A0A074ZIJ8_OPIVI|nr:hypothetical protein T265_06022 [Opisthorchis viverrini]KER26811.1 hypothetical protein T265_06022 [Opisthorchis viverrini]